MVINAQPVNQLETRSAISPINVISLICFQLSRVVNGNDGISSEEHFENCKTNRGSHFNQQLVRPNI
jgi:hypothetical protein